VITQIQIIEIAGAVSSFLGVWFLRKQSILYWPFNLLSSILCIIVFQQKGIYAQMCLQFLYIIISFYGIYNWLKHSKEGSQLEILHFTRKTVAYILVAGLLLTSGLYFLLSHFTPSKVVFLDAFTTSFSIIGTYLFTKKYIETWLLWIAVDVVGICLFLYTGLYSMALLYLIFIGTAIQGYGLWKKSFIENNN